MGEAVEGGCPRASEGASPVDAWSPDFWPPSPETAVSSVSGPCVCGDLRWRP